MLARGDVYEIFRDGQGVDLSLYEGQSVAVYGIFQTQGSSLSAGPPANALPDTGGFSPAVLVVVALLLLGGGGLLVYSFIRRQRRRKEPDA